MRFHVTSKWIDAHTSVSRCKNAEISIDTALEGTEEAFNPAELLLSALTACMIKGIMRVSPMLDFKLNGIEIIIDGVRQDAPPKMESIDYEIIVDTDESDDRLELLHKNVRKYGTVFNTVSAGTKLNGILRRR